MHIFLSFTDTEFKYHFYDIHSIFLNIKIFTSRLLEAIYILKFKTDLYNPNEHFVNIEIRTSSFLNNRIPFILELI